MTTTGFPTLPQGQKRFSVEQLLIEVAPLIGLRAGAMHALLHMMKCTRPNDWTSTDSEPVFFGLQSATARRLGKTRRALYNIEVKLEALGLIERRVKANGQRSSYGDCGIVFSPLIRLVPDLLNLAERHKAEEREKRSLANIRSSHLRYIKSRLQDIEEDSAAKTHVVSEIDTWPRSDALYNMPLVELKVHVECTKAMCITVDDLLTIHEESTGETEENFPSHIQENNLSLNTVKCNEHVKISSADKSAQAIEPKPQPNGRGNCLEKKNVASGSSIKAKILDSFTPRRIFELASPEMQAIIRDEAGGRPFRLSDFFNAAHKSLAHLGINHSAWNDALDVMGPDQTWLAVFILDANRDHPRHPVLKPGGALRGLTHRCLQGRLNLSGSLIGLARRKGISQI